MMIRHRMTTLLVSAAMLAVPALAAAQSVSYVESSAGLQLPGMEGGDTELEFGDVNGDGHIDLVCVGDHGSPYINTQQHGVMVWFGDGAGAWSLFQYGNFGYGGVALGDVNNDGLMDVGYGVHHDYNSGDLGDQILEVALGDGTGQYWTAYDDGLATNGEDWGMFGTDFADVDNDGDLDVGSISFGCCAGVHVYLNNGDGSWTQSFGFLGGNAADIFVFGDVNGDGNADFATAHDDGTIYLGDGAGGFTLDDGNLPGSSWRQGLALGDVNDDGIDDLAFIDSFIKVFAWTGPGQWEDLTGNLGPSGSAKFAQIADMNLDGHGDIVALFDGWVRIWGGDGAGAWELLAEFAVPDACGWAAMRAGGDVDHNGYPDFAFISEENCSPWTGGANRPRCFREASTPIDPLIHPRSPRGGESFIAGSVRFIDWYSAVPATAGDPTMTIELSTTGPGGAFTVIATGVPNNGRYQWLLPGTLPASQNCCLRFTLDTAPPTVQIMPTAFTILNPNAPTPGDVNGDGVVNVEDLLMVLAAWGPCPACGEDLNGDGVVNVLDLLIVLGNWS